MNAPNFQLEFGKRPWVTAAFGCERLIRLSATLFPQIDAMEEKIVMNDAAGWKSESRNVLNKYYSVQFCVNGMDTTYLFKLRDIPLNGLCILVKEDSPVLKELKSATY